ncbi:MAG: alkaline phosphatase family protein [Actinomycetota bacterium]|nr:alkaline phosphatase family protein [Actinomycetota bacterium]
MIALEAAPFVEPAYGIRSLGDVLPAVAGALGITVELPETRLELPPGEKYVVFLIDGLGHHQLAEHAQDAPYLHSLLDGSLVGTAGVPSTTSTSLTSLGTALVPGAHGLVGFTTRVPETGRLLNALKWDKRVDPEEWQPNPTAFGRLAAAGVHTTVVSKREFAHSGLSDCFQRGAAFVGADRVGERIAAVVEAAWESPSLTYVYDGDLDWTGHRYGVDSLQWRAQLAAIDTGAEQLRQSLGRDTRMVVVADHGMVDSPTSARLDIAQHAELRSGVQLLGGEARFRHLYCEHGAAADVTAAWREVLGERATVLTRDEVVARGWFGPVAAGVRPRLGDVVVAAHDDFALISSADFAYETKLIGLHGSLTPREMLIPILVS